MQEPLGTESLKNAPERHAGLDVGPAAQCVAQSRFRHEPVYDLRSTAGSSSGFYAEVSRFSDRLLEEIDSCAGATVRAYSEYAQSEVKEPPRSTGEYSIDLLTLGMAFRLYAGAALATPGWVVHACRALYRLRQQREQLKPAADLLRAWMLRVFFMLNMRRKANRPLSPADLPRLIESLQATGEFEQEAARLDVWNSYFGSIRKAEAAYCIEAATRLFDWFQREADHALGVYTYGVPGFLSGEYAARGCREDQIFCGKQPVEYHLNMVAAEIMNRGLRPAFESKMEKVVLVPGCMRGPYDTFCRGRSTGTDMQCSACSPGCRVNRLTRLMRSLGAEVYVIPHSSGFSHWLERWQRSPQVSVVAIACMLNILPGGYEMRARGIASQCVPLDYPGCQKHWHADGIATGVNEDRLVQIVTSAHN